MILLADRHIPWLDELLPPEITLHRFDGGRPPDSLLSQAEALLIRTVTKVNADLLASAPNLKWIGTATAGFDHVDVDAVRRAGVTLYVAEGCNASAVGDYVRRAMRDVRSAIIAPSAMRDVRSEDPLASHIAPRTSIAIIGYGHTGRAAAEPLKKLGFEVLPYDPPLGLPARWDDVLACDAVTVHVPLTFDGPHKTHHLISAADLARAKWRLLIQASRGGVVEEATLKAWITPGIRDAVVDVWENEPSPDPELVALAAIATPHIAGYSVEAKFRATRMCVERLLSVFGSRFSVKKFSVVGSRFSVEDVQKHVTETSPLFTENRKQKTENLLQSLSTQLKASPTAETFKELRNNSPLRSEAE
jgi:erythronate-4-phosphate dehydrogenase